jgi:hypothetical protein
MGRHDFGIAEVHCRARRAVIRLSISRNRFSQ